MKFEWDKRKNSSNIKKHDISFEEAAFVFSDMEAISIPDEYHSDFEERWITIGKIKNRGLIVVVHTDRMKRDGEVIRIISARKAEKYEEKEYVNRLGER